jgi:hypothetical protein
MAIMNVQVSTLLLTTTLPALAVGCLEPEPYENFRSELVEEGEVRGDYEGDGEEDDGGGVGDGGDCLHWKHNGGWPDVEIPPLCDLGYIEILDTAPQGDPWYALAHQYIIAHLNMASGISTPVEVVEALTTAEDFLANCEISDSEKESLGVWKVLTDYNDSAISLGGCD